MQIIYQWNSFGLVFTDLWRETSRFLICSSENKLAELYATDFLSYMVEGIEEVHHEKTYGSNPSCCIRCAAGGLWQYHQREFEHFNVNHSNIDGEMPNNNCRYDPKYWHQ